MAILALTTSLKDMTEFMQRYFRRNDRPITFSQIEEVQITQRSRAGRVGLELIERVAGRKVTSARRGTRSA